MKGTRAISVLTGILVLAAGLQTASVTLVPGESAERQVPRSRPKFIKLFSPLQHGQSVLWALVQIQPLKVRRYCSQYWRAHSKVLGHSFMAVDGTKVEHKTSPNLEREEHFNFFTDLDGKLSFLSYGSVCVSLPPFHPISAHLNLSELKKRQRS